MHRLIDRCDWNPSLLSWVIFAFWYGGSWQNVRRWSPLLRRIRRIVCCETTAGHICHLSVQFSSGSLFSVTLTMSRSRSRRHTLVSLSLIWLRLPTIHHTVCLTSSYGRWLLTVHRERAPPGHRFPDVFAIIPHSQSPPHLIYILQASNYITLGVPRLVHSQPSVPRLQPRRMDRKRRLLVYCVANETSYAGITQAYTHPAILSSFSRRASSGTNGSLPRGGVTISRDSCGV
jgi:hypothetical protein